MYTRLLWENLRDRDHLGDPGIYGTFKNCDVGIWTGLLWFRIGTSGGHL
jgi:hypothetical protein